MSLKLDSSVGTIPLVGPAYEIMLEKLAIRTVQDLLYHVPARYVDFSEIGKMDSSEIGESITLQGEVLRIKNIFTRSGKRIQEAYVSDGEAQFPVIWFNQTYIPKALPPETLVSLSGKVGEWGGKKAMIAPIYEKVFESASTIHTGGLIPIYPETSGVSSKWLRSRIDFALKNLEGIDDPLSTTTREKYKLVLLQDALNQIHQPPYIKSAESARYRLAFDELLNIHLRTLVRKRTWGSLATSNELSSNTKLIDEFSKIFPFTLTKSQNRSIKEVSADLKKKSPMNRLLEGDVGSGKTAVAAYASYVAIKSGYQAAIMAPTQILAMQHYESLSKLFRGKGVRINLLTSNKKITAKNPNLYIGTHSLIHKAAEFDQLAVVVIDEQHRFGVEQRQHLVKKGKSHSKAPHILTMTATPIPRTIAHVLYGDLDLSTLDEMPLGRKKITTKLVKKNKKRIAYKWIAEKLTEQKSQMFVVCPLIEDSDKETMKQVRSATTEHERFTKLFPNHKVGLLHGRLKAAEKEAVIAKFKSYKLDILVSTPVVEVGVDIANATIMLIQTPERFGLAQLHQLRGRVGRGEKKSYCLLFTDGSSPKAYTRLQALQNNSSGHVLAELDLALRGPGELYGTKQHGYPELKIANWDDKKLIKVTKTFAEKVLSNPTDHPMVTIPLAGS